VVDASVSRRYARALFALAVEDGAHERVAEELSAVGQALRASKEARTLVENPGYTQAQRHALIGLLEQQLSLSPLVARFLRLLVDRHRLVELSTMALAYAEMVDERVGRVRATVTSAKPLTDEELRRLRDAFGALTRHTIVLDSRTDPKIVGGLVAHVGPQVFDGSIKTQLERLRRDLKGGAP
jgi:F-type H+-transporting ATPase subunit delta